MIEFRNVSYRIGEKQILANLTLKVEAGERLVLLGRSGSGKTTALKMVNALIRPTSGAVVVDGKPTTEWDLIRLRRGIGYVIQEAGLFPHFTVGQNVSLVPRLEGKAPNEIEARVRDLLDLVELPARQFLHRFPRELSGGQRQRVGVARALAADPPLLLLDEPFGALDPVTRHEIQRQFLGICERLHKTVIFVTHDAREAMRIATRIGLLREGRLEALEAPSNFFNTQGAEVEAFRTSLQ